MKKTLFRKLNFLIAIASIFAALVVGGCANLLSSTSSDDDSAPVNVVYPAVTVENGRGIVRGTLPQETSASTRTAMPDVPTISSYKVFAQNGSTTIEANVDNANKTFSISLPYGTWNVTANGLLANNRVVYTQTQSVTVSATNPTVDLPFTSLSYSTNPDDGEGEISLTITLDSSATSTITAIDYTLTKGEENITRKVSDTDLGAGNFKIERTTENLGAWYLTINCYGDNANLVYRVDETVNVYANLTTDTFVGSAPYISSGAINITQAMLTEFQQTTLYVHATDGKDTNTGTQFDPLQTFNRAVELVNNSTRPAGTEFRIFLKSNVNDGADLELKAGKKLTVANADNTNYTITSLGRNFTVAATSELTVKDIQFQKLRFVVNGAFTMNGGTISGNEVDDYGGGIYNEGTLTIIGGTISNCTTTGDGGGIYNSGTFTMNGGEISGNDAQYGGGIYNNKGTLTITGGEISGNTASYGGIYNYRGTLTITGGEISGNDAQYGGGIYNTGTLTITGGEISGNTATSYGGGIYNYSPGTLTITGSGTTISNCTAVNGGGIYNRGSSASAEITGCTITDCTVNGGSSMTGSRGGGIYNDAGSFTITSGTISNCTARNGGGIYNTGTLTITGGEISGNKIDSSGGGIYNDAGTLTITGATISNCTSKDSSYAKSGGGIYNRGSSASAEITGCTITGCTVNNGYYQSNGGGIYNYQGTLTFSDGTIEKCKADNGGGVFITATSTIVMEDSTISGNTATRQGNGAYVITGSTIEMGGSAQFASDNEIYLANTSTTTAPLIQIASALTGTTPVATITLSVYEAGKQVLQASSGGTITSDICGKFALTPAPDGIEWEISPDSTGAKGVLNRNSLYVRGTGAGWYTENPAYTASAGSDSNSGSKSSPFATIQKAIEKVLEMNDGTSEYTIYVDGTITGGATATANGMGDISPDKDLLLKIESMSATTHATLDAEGSGRVLNINANATVALNNVNIANGTTADNGGGINNLGTLTITGGTISNCTTTVTGGGIYNGSGAELTITDGNISNCEASSNGGGIYNGGTLTITDGNISNCEASSNGGGIYNGGTLTITDGNISNCEASTTGGGIYNGGTLTITDTTISGCYVRLYGAGGGVYNWSTFIMTGGTISGNTAYSGGGVYVARKTFTMEGGTISGNSAPTGNGAYVKEGSTLEMGGSARFASDNDVYLDDDTSIAGVPTIQIASALTGTIPVATITPSVYTAGKQVLSLATGSTTTLANEYQKFAVSDEKWGIDDEGKLFSDLWVSSTGDDTNGSGTKTAPFATLQRAIDEIKTLNDSTASYTIHIVGNVVGTSAIGSDVPARAILITGTSSSTDVLDGNGASQVILNVACTATVKLTNIKLTNGANGGIRVETGANVTLGADAVVSGNSTTTNGGGVYVADGGEFTMAKSEISNNTAAGYGGGICIDGGTFTMMGGEITGNTATYGGGGVFLNGSSSCSIYGGTFSKNRTDGFGGGVAVDGKSEFTLVGRSTISECTAADSGGGVYVAKDSLFNMYGTETKITNCKTMNTADADKGGGGIYNDGGTVTIMNGTISGCTAGRSGGGVFVHNDGTLKMYSGGEISGNGNESMVYAGGVYIDGGTFTMHGGAISGNTAQMGAGVRLYQTSTTFTMYGGEITGNTATHRGGGVYINQGTFTITGGTITGNTGNTGGKAGVDNLNGTFNNNGGTVQDD